MLKSNIPITQLNKNYDYLFQNISSNLSFKEDYIYKKDKILPSNDQAKDFPVHVYVRHFTNGDIEIFNLLPEQVTIKSIKYKTFTMPLDLVISGYIDGHYEPNIIKTSFLGPADGKITVTTEYKGNIRYRKNEISLVPGPYFNPINDIEPLETNFLIKTDNAHIIKKGSWVITRPTLIDGDLIIEPGTKISFENESYIIVKGSLTAIGNIDENIELSSTSPWKGIYVISKNKEDSKLYFVNIKNTRALSDGLLRLTGGVNFYNANVIIKNSKILGTIAEDALNIINSNFLIEQSEIGGTISDAFDSDFSNGLIVDSNFYDVGGDAIDFSGSDVKVESSSFNNIRDKAISVGESTIINIQNINISDSGVGIASKDGSKAFASNVNIRNYSLYAAMTYVKKDFYDMPTLIGENIKTFPVKTDSFLAQKDTSMVINNNFIETKEIDIEALYQTDTMKK